jgi:hypothetical protein
MQDATWVRGIGDLAVSFPDRDQDPEVLEARGGVYRRELGSLSDEAWLYAVREAIRNERWFPTIAVLLDYAARAPIAAPSAALPDDTRTPEEKREDAKRLLEVVRAAYEERVATLPPRPIVTTPPPGGREVIASDERLDELRRQAREITTDQAETTTVEGGV